MKLPRDTGAIHFVGIGGIGMSGIAEVMHQLGYKVQGSDISDSYVLEKLRKAGIPVSIGHSSDNLGDAVSAALAFLTNYTETVHRLIKKGKELDLDVSENNPAQGPAVDRLRDAPIKQVVITDSIPLPPNKQLPNIKVLSVAPLLADAIKRIHFNESVSKLFE